MNRAPMAQRAPADDHREADKGQVRVEGEHDGPDDPDSGETDAAVVHRVRSESGRRANQPCLTTSS